MPAAIARPISRGDGLAPRPRLMRALLGATSLSVFVALSGSPAAAAGVEERIRILEQNLAVQSEALAKQIKILEQQKRELRALKAASGKTPKGKPGKQAPAAAGQAPAAALTAPNGQSKPRGGRPPASQRRQAAQPQRPQQTAAQTAQGTGVTAPATSAPAEDEKQKRPQIDVEALVERGGVLTPPGTLIVEPSIEYLHDSGNRVLIEGLSVLPAILIGTIDVRRVERDTVISAMTGRVGVTNRLDFDVKVPYVYRKDETTAREIAAQSSANEVTTVSGHGLGDMEFAGHYQLNNPERGFPYLISNLRVKTPTGRDPFEVSVNEQGLQTELPTGTGFWAMEPSLSFLLPSPPVVWFGNVKYLWNIERDIGGGFGTIDPGDAVGATIGLGFSVNQRTSFSLGAEYQSVFETEQNGQNVAGTSLQIASGLLGMSYRATDNVLLNLSLQGGFTDDATDFRALFRVPVTLKVFNNLIPGKDKDKES